MNNIINKLLGSELVHGKRIKEVAYFKNNFVRYYVKQMADGGVEFWGHTTIPLENINANSDKRQSYYLGAYYGDAWVQPDNFHHMPWEVQKSAQRLYEKFLSRQ